MTTPIKWSSEFLVPTTNSADQSEPSIAALPDGRFVVVWMDGSRTGGDTSFTAVRGQVLNADGSKSGSEFLVNTATDGYQQYAAVAAIDGGRFVVTWQTESTTGDMSPTAIAAQMFDAGGAKIGSEFLVNTTTNGAQQGPAVAGFGGGPFVVAWTDYSGANADIRAQRFTAGGAKSGVEIVVNAITAKGQFEPSVATLSNGSFVVAWTDGSESGADTSSLAVRARLFSAAGAPLSQDFLVNTSTESHQFAARVTALAGGRFVVTWSDYSQSGADKDASALSAQIFNNDGSRVGAQFLINSATRGDQADPVIAALPDGGFVAVWQDVANYDADLAGQVFSAEGVRQGTEFFVDAPDATAHGMPAIAALTDGRFVVSFAEDTSSGFDVRARIFDPRIGPAYFAGTALNDQYAGTSHDDVLQGGAGLDWLIGGDGDDTLHGGAGADTLDGGTGRDTATYVDSTEGVEVDLAAKTAKLGDAQGDKLIGIENLIGSAYTDTLKGDDADNALYGLDGTDQMKGAGGNDVLTGGRDGDFIDGGSGDDTAVYLDDFARYQVASASSGEILLLAPGEIDVLSGIEHLQFRDGRIDLEDGSALFDTLYYLASYRDIYHAGMNALEHFNTLGWREGRDPVEDFDTSGYLANNPDIAAADMNPLEHYHLTGWREGRDPSASFDTTLYLLLNPDVAAAGIDPLEHYLTHGRAEARPTHVAVGDHIQGGFDAQYYLFDHADVAAAGVDPLQHFEMFGWHEGRNPNGWFDAAGYLAHYADVAAAGVNPLEHYIAFGWKEGRDPSAWFDTAGYLAANPDVAAAEVNPLEHFLTFGAYEGRKAVNDGMWD